MRIAVTQAQGQLTELVKLAEAGEDVILTRHGQPTVRLVPIWRGWIAGVIAADRSALMAIGLTEPEAYARWGKGGHPASLNYGDCFSYEVAKANGCPLLFVGNDFYRPI